MLTRELAIAKLERGRVHPDRLTPATHAIYPDLARRMIGVYQAGVGQTRRELHRAIVEILEEDRACPVRRMAAFCKLLDEYGRFDGGKPKSASTLRRRVFALAAQYHPLVDARESILEHRETEVKERIANAFEIPWPELQRRLFEDLIEFHRLQSWNPPSDPIELLSRYNVAQTQAALLDAVSIRIDASSDWKMILRYAKLAGLMHTIVPTSHGYRIELDGPASVLRNTHRYGASMAKFLPGLLSCQGWSMTAIMRSKFKNNSVGPVLELSDRSGLRSNVAPVPLADSELERRWMESWGTGARDGWSLVREGEILIRGQKVFIPDFVLAHDSGRRILLEIAGFWTPGYIAHRAATLAMFADVPILIAIPKGSLKRWQSVPWSPNHRRIVFGTRLKIEDVMDVILGMVATP